MQSNKITPEQLHQWYLDATKLLNPESFNPKARVPYSELTEEQQVIDKYICDQINFRITQIKKELLK